MISLFRCENGFVDESISSWCRGVVLRMDRLIKTLVVCKVDGSIMAQLWCARESEWCSAGEVNFVF
ncbi:hypothetical protein V6Z12_D02G170300 [Gossypium hirsutum]